MLENIAWFQTACHSETMLGPNARLFLLICYIWISFLNIFHIWITKAIVCAVLTGRQGSDLL